MADKGFIQHWNGRYLTSNVFWAQGSGPRAGQPLGSRYTVVTGPNTGIKLLVLGFLYDFTRASKIVDVRKVQDVLQEEWIDEAFQKESPDAVVVLAHMDLSDNLVYKILEKLRRIDGTVPVAVMAGHTHYRGFLQLDANAASIESGKYLDTVSQLSFNTRAKRPAYDYPRGDPQRQPGSGPHPAGAPAPSSVAVPMPVAATTLFTHAFIDANLDSLAAAVGLSPEQFGTPAGAFIKAEIALVRAALGLDRVIGCAPQTYTVRVDFEQKDSLWRLYMLEVIPKALFTPPANPDHWVALSSVGSLRYDLYEGSVTRDDYYTIAPFRNQYVCFSHPSRFTGQQVRAVLDFLEVSVATMHDTQSNASWASNHEGAGNSNLVLPSWLASGFVDSTNQLYDIVSNDYDAVSVQAAIFITTGYRVEPEAYRPGDVDSSNVWEHYIEKEWACNQDLATDDEEGGGGDERGRVKSVDLL